MAFDGTKRRLVIVDANHMAYNFLAVGAPMSYKLKTGEIIDTRIPNGISKNIWKWSRRGMDDVIVCMDRPCPSRKAYFSKETGEDYKGGRQFVPAIRMGMYYAQRLLEAGGVTVLAADNYEADDLIGACITAFYGMYDYIDVVTGDQDMLPLADSKVSVFLRSRKMTYAGDPSIQKNKYIQINVNSFEQVISDNWQNRKNELVYNSIILEKILQGDKSDGYVGPQKITASGRSMAKFSPKKYNELLETMVSDGVDMAGTFRYSLLESIPGETMLGIRKTLEPYMDNEDDLNHVMRTYYGMNLNSPFTVETLGEENLDKTRGRYSINGTPKPVSFKTLSDSARAVGINIRY